MVGPLDKRRRTQSATPARRVAKIGKADNSSYLAILNADSPHDACSSRGLADRPLHSRKDEESILNRFPIDRVKPARTAKKCVLYTKTRYKSETRSISKRGRTARRFADEQDRCRF